jgi:rfaE bifunctional protein kinase chain/domain
MTVRALLAAFPGMSALVAGDVCLDRWCTYDPALAEPSRETGIPRTAVIRTQTTAGAAGTVANNLAALGVGRVSVLGMIGDDGFGVELSRALSARKIGSDYCVRARGAQTFTYTKLINAQSGREDLPRIDFLNAQPLDNEVERKLLDAVAAAVDAHDVILISDQAETSQGGVVTPAMRELIHELALGYRDKIFFVDSRTRIELFRAAILKPNQQEAESACRRLFGAVDYPALARHADSPLLLVTHGADGVLAVRDGTENWVRARPVENPVDICGAGDSFSAGCAMALAAGAPPEAAARFGNLVASVTIMKPGTGTASPEEVVRADEDARH